MKKCYFVALLVILAICTGQGAGHAKVYIDIYSPSSSRLPIVIPAFKNMGSRSDTRSLAANMPRVIRDDLEFSGFFKILDPAVLDEALLRGLTRNEIKWDSLSIIGAEAIITGGFSYKKNKKITAELRLFDAVQGRFITGKKYEGTVDDYRLICHRFSDEIFKKLTGADSVFNTKIAYVKDIGAKKDLHIMDYDGKNSKQITWYGSLTLSPAWSPDGEKIAFTSYKNGNPDLYVKEIYTGNVKNISRKKGINIAPSWSPDGKKIALTLSLNNGNSEIYTVDLTSGKLVRLTHDWATDVSPAWSPDGKKIAFVSSRSGTPQIYRLTLKTGKVKRLTYEGNYNTSPAWSPRGDLIAYAGLAGGTFNIHVVSSDGTFSNQTTFAGDNEDPAWSPDGRFITFSSTRTGRKEIFIMRADGTGQKQITSGRGEKSDPAWSPLLGR